MTTPSLPPNAALVPSRPSRARARLNRKERAFLPAALEIVETPASPALRLTSFDLIALIVSALVWSYLSHVDIIATAEGKVVPIGQIKQVQPLEAGLVRAVHVAEGDRVTAGQVLIEIDPTEQKANLEQGRYDRMQALFDAESARILLAGELDTEFRLPPDADAVLADAMKAQTHDALAKHHASINAFASQIAEKQAAVAANAAQMTKNEQTLPLLQERYDALHTLVKQSLAQPQNWQKARQDLVDSRAEIAVLREHGVQTEAEIRSLESRRVEALAAFRADASDKRLRALQKAAQLEQQITKERRRDQQRHLVAPVTGTVLGLKAHTIGGVVTAADVLMSIVPEGVPLEIEALVQNQDIGFLQEGQPVEIKVEAFTFTRYGTVPGRLIRISRDAVPRGTALKDDTAKAAGNGQPAGSQGQGANDLVYPVRITLDKKSLMVGDRERPVTTGMRVVAEIKTDQRRVIQFLLDKVLATFMEAGRER